MTQTQDTGSVASGEAREQVRQFFAGTSTLTRSEIESLWREERRSGVRWLSTEPEFLCAVAEGSWGSECDAVAREIRKTARAQAAKLAPWPRRRAVASAMEHAALAVFSTYEPTHPLGPTLPDRLLHPWQRAAAGVVPAPRTSSE